MAQADFLLSPALCVCVCGGGFFDGNLCQAREQPRHGQLTLAFLSLVLTWAVAVFWGKERSL